MATESDIKLLDHADWQYRSVFYGIFHFNTPNYALGGSLDQGTNTSAFDASVSRVNGLAPPKFTTTRSLYQRYMLKYVAILEVSFWMIKFS